MDLFIFFGLSVGETIFLGHSHLSLVLIRAFPFFVLSRRFPSGYARFGCARRVLRGNLFDDASHDGTSE